MHGGYLAVYSDGIEGHGCTFSAYLKLARLGDEDSTVVAFGPNTPVSGHALNDTIPPPQDTGWLAIVRRFLAQSSSQPSTMESGAGAAVQISSTASPKTPPCAASVELQPHHQHQPQPISSPSGESDSPTGKISLNPLELVHSSNDSLVRQDLSLPDTVTESVAADNSASSSQRGSSRALIVDDSKLNRKLLGRYLTSYFDEILHAENGQIAIGMVKDSVAKKVPFDIVFIDNLMPVLNGVQAVRLLRESYMPLTPIVGITGKLQ